MHLPWQDIFALALVSLAAGYLGWQTWRLVARRRASACGGGSCAGCNAASTVAGKPLVTIQGLESAGRLESRTPDGPLL